jgi:carbamoyl-phosphate synthase large subunit
MGLARDFGRAYAKSQLGAGNGLPLKGTVFISVKDKDKQAMVGPGRSLVEQGFRLVATDGTAAYLKGQGLPVERINKVLQGRPHVVDAMKSGQVQLVFNTVEGAQSIADSFSLREAALVGSIPYCTTVAAARAAVAAIGALKQGDLEVAPLQSYFKGSFS